MSKLVNAWHNFLKTHFNSIMRSSPNIYKERKFEHVDIRRRFEEVEKERKSQRLAIIEYKKSLKLNLLKKQLNFLEQYKGVDLITDKNIQKEMEKLKKQAPLKNTQSFEEHMKNVLKKEEDLNLLEIATQAKDERSQKDLMAKLKNELSSVEKDIEEIKKMKSELEVIDEQMEELEPTHVVVSGLQKKIVLNMITYYEFQSRNLHGVLINPETLKAIETVHYHVEHNLPIRRELLYEVVPEIFENEIELLEPEERKRILGRRPRFDNDEKSILKVIEKEDFEPREAKLHFYEELKKQEFDMRNFVYKKAIEFANKYEDHLEQKLGMGFYSLAKVLENIEAKDESALSDIEKQVLDGIRELRKINSDYAELIKLNKVRIFNKQREPQIPEFVKNNKVLLAAWVDKWEQLVANSFDIKDSILVPDNKPTIESKLEHVLNQQKTQDLQSLIQASQLEYKQNVSGDTPILTTDRTNKNEDLLKKLSVLTGAMNNLPEDDRSKRMLPKKSISHPDSPEEKRILVDEMPKILYLNNRDPRKHTLKFWATHFNIDPAKLRNIFNFISYAIPDVTNEKETGRVFRFISDESEVK